MKTRGVAGLTVFCFDSFQGPLNDKWQKERTKKERIRAQVVIFPAKKSLFVVAQDPSICLKFPGNHSRLVE